MKIFLSWSGTRAHNMARLLYEWLPKVLPAAQPFLSSENIKKGIPWASALESELCQSPFGILCLTRENVDSPGIVFEAGALCFALPAAHVFPLFLDVPRGATSWPLSLRQATVVERTDVLRLLRTINDASGLEKIDDSRLRKVFAHAWPSLMKEMEKIRNAPFESYRQVLTWADIDNALDSLEAKLAETMFEPEMIIGCGKGGAICASILAKRLAKPLKVVDQSKPSEDERIVDYMPIQNAKGKFGVRKLRAQRFLPMWNVHGKNVLVVEYYRNRGLVYAQLNDLLEEVCGKVRWYAVLQRADVDTPAHYRYWEVASHICPPWQRMSKSGTQ